VFRRSARRALRGRRSPAGQRLRLGWRAWPALTLRGRTSASVALALCAFAGNSLLCRQALRATSIDPTTFTGLRLCAGALALALIVAARRRRDARSALAASSAPVARVAAARGHGSWPSACALWLYAAAFSEAYVALTAGTGALLLFGAVQLTMLSTAFVRGARFTARQWSGFALAVGGLVVLVLPGVARPPLVAATSMAVAGVAWGVYSLRGRSATDAIAVNAGNFWRASVLALAVGGLRAGALRFDAAGVGYALASGALASGCGYALWYTVLPRLHATSAATVQLAVPVLAALAGVALLDEPSTLRLALAASAVLGGVAATLRR